MNEFIYFLKNPYFKISADTAKGAIYRFLSAYLFCMCFIIIGALVIVITEAILKYHFHISSPMNNYHHVMEGMHKRFGEYSVLIIIIVAPILEETMFRLYLTLDKWFILISAAVLTYAFTGPVISINSQMNLYPRILIVAAVLIVLAWLINNRSIEWLRNKYYYLIFYFSAFLFGMVHITNFRPLNENIFFIYPILVLPQIGMGLSLGYVRIRLKNGFLWSVMLHSLINAHSVILSLI